MLNKAQYAVKERVASVAGDAHTVAVLDGGEGTADVVLRSGSGHAHLGKVALFRGDAVRVKGDEGDALFGVLH